jgi:single-strand DNA-binding protein
MSNVFSFSGIVGKPADLRHLPSGQTVLHVNVATDVGWGEKKQTLWIRVNLWGKRAEGELKNFLLTGQHVFVSGELTLSEYTTNDGKVKTQLELHANILDLVGKREQQKHEDYSFKADTPAFERYDPSKFDPNEIPF